MGQTAIISPQILDSTTIGRDLITAATVASAHAALDLEDTAFSYSLTQTFEAGLVTQAITSAANLVTTMPAGGQGQYYFGANPIYLMSATEFRPAEALTVATLGSATRRWSNVYSVDGNFSGTVTADTLQSTSTSYPTPPQIYFSNDGGFIAAANSTTVLRWTTSSLEARKNFTPRLDNTLACGTDALKWASVASVDGSFTGNLTSEVGGSIRQYNSGTDGDTDTQFGGMDFSSNVFRVGTQKTGAGTVRDLGLIRGGSYKLYIGSSETSSYQRLVPTADASYSLGKAGKAWSSVHSVDGSFSGNLTSEVGGSYRLYNLGDEGDTDSQFLNIFQDGTNTRIQSDATGAGTASTLVVRSGSTGGYMLATPSQFQIGAGGVATFVGTAFNMTINKPLLMGTANIAIGSTSGNRVSKINCVAADFSGTVTTDSIDSTGSSLIVSNNGTEKLEITSSRIRPSVNFFPKNNNFVVCGQDGSRWKSVGSVDGSFTGNLVSEVGGSYKLYNLGAEGDTDTEYLETSFDTNVATIASKATGAGTQRSMEIDAANVKLSVNGALKFQVAGNGITYSYQSLQPSNSTIPLGHDARRWSTVFGVDADFSGDVIMAANVDFTGLPTSDPSVAGRLWNDGGTMKISAG